MGVLEVGGTAVITGAGSGIGRGLAVELAGRGMNVVLAGRRREKLDRVEGELADRPVGVRVVPCDVGSAADVAALREEAVRAFGSVELVCLNAATTTAGPLVDATVEDWEWVHRNTVLGAVHGIREFVPAMVRAGRGQVLITGSISGLVPDGFLLHGPYAALKSAVNAMALNLREELRGTGVDVALLVPGPTGTDMVNTSAFRPDGHGAAEPDLFQIGPRPGAPIEMADHFLEPAEVARRAVVGLERGLPIIVSHTSMVALAREFCDRVMAAFDVDLASPAPVR